MWKRSDILEHHARTLRTPRPCYGDAVVPLIGIRYSDVTLCSHPQCCVVFFPRKRRGFRHYVIEDSKFTFCQNVYRSRSCYCQRGRRKILEMMDVMQAVDTENVEPLAHPLDALARLRTDEVTAINQRDQMQKIALYS